MVTESKKYNNEELEVSFACQLTNNSTGPWATSESNSYAVNFFADTKEIAEGFIAEVMVNVPLTSKKILKKEIKGDRMGGYECELQYESTIYFN